MPQSNAKCLDPGCEGQVTIQEGWDHQGFTWECTCGARGSFQNGTRPESIFQPIIPEQGIIVIPWVRPVVQQVVVDLPI